MKSITPECNSYGMATATVKQAPLSCSATPNTQRENTLQAKKSKNDGDSTTEMLDDVVNVVFDNGAKIIGVTPVTKAGGFASGFYQQSESFQNTLELIKQDGFSVKALAGSALEEIADRLKAPSQYLSMNASAKSMAISYGFAAVNVVNTVISCFSTNPVARARQRGYTLY